MNKTDLIKFHKKELTAAELRLSIARQMINEATQSKVEHKSALDTLGAKPERTPRGGKQLPDNVKLRLVGDLTKKKSA